MVDGTVMVPGKDDVDYLEELQQTGPGGPIPYIRCHFVNGAGYADFPKHNLSAVWYTPTRLTSAPTTVPTTP
jgi:hypothetical protein